MSERNGDKARSRRDRLRRIVRRKRTRELRKTLGLAAPADRTREVSPSGKTAPQ